MEFIVMIDLQEEDLNADEAFALSWYKEDNTYTCLGGLVHDIKYEYIKNNIISDEEASVCLDEIISELVEYTNGIDLILPIPSYNPRTKSNPNGEYKTMYLVAEGLSNKTEIPWNSEIVRKITERQAKSEDINQEDFEASLLPSEFRDAKILLIDDLYEAGTTARYTLNALKNKNPHIFIRFVSLTKNKYGGMRRKVDCSIASPEIYSSINEDKYIRLKFLRNNEEKKLCVYETSKYFEVIDDARRKGQLSKIFRLPVYKNLKGFWNVYE